jgi:hypothetical protein
MGPSRHARNCGHAERAEVVISWSDPSPSTQAKRADQRIRAARHACGRRRPLHVRAPRLPDSRGQQNAWPRTAGTGAVTLTARPVSLPRRPCDGGRSRTARRHDPAGYRHTAPADGRALQTEDAARPTPAPPNPSCHTGDRRQPPGRTPEPGQATAASTRDPQTQPTSLMTQRGQPRCALMHELSTRLAHCRWASAGGS